MATKVSIATGMLCMILQCHPSQSFSSSSSSFLPKSDHSITRLGYSSPSSSSSSNRSPRRRNSFDSNDFDDFDHNGGDDWFEEESNTNNNKRSSRPREYSERKNNESSSTRPFRNNRGRDDRRNTSPRDDFRKATQAIRQPPKKSAEEPESITDTNSHFYSKKTLKDPSLGIEQHELFLSLAQGAGITRPSRIQSLAWPQILSGVHTLVADQTGSGKTLAYLLPLLQRALATAGPSKKTGAPKILVLAPTAELADQLREVCDKIALTVKFSTMVVTATGKLKTSIRDQIRMIQRQPMDVLISTPGRISTILRTRNSGLDLSQLQAIVLDEVDILLIDETFGPQLRTVGEAAPLEKTQFVFVTATLPDSIVQKVEQEFPGVVQVRGPGLHRVAPTLKENLVDVSVPSSSNRDADLCFDVKAKQLLKALRLNRCRRTLIFCNTVESCRSVENLLNRKDRKGQVFDVGAYHNAMTPEARNKNLDRFAKGTGQDDDNVDYVLICTDRAARGVDFDAAPVDHVVIFDFPKDPAEYVRRVGRTARAGRTGASTVFAFGWQLPIARNIMGSKLNSFTMAIDEKDDGDEDEYKTRKQLNKRGKNMKDTIKANIENGLLWDN